MLAVRPNGRNGAILDLSDMGRREMTVEILLSVVRSHLTSSYIGTNADTDIMGLLIPLA
jgi:hypothetical protein